MDQGRCGGFLGSGLWNGGKDCVEWNGSERAKVASVASKEAPRPARSCAPAGYPRCDMPGGTSPGSLARAYRQPDVSYRAKRNRERGTIPRSR